jgi:hypothetical protein
MQDLIHQQLKKLYFRAPVIDLPSTWQVVQQHYLFEHFSDDDLRKIMESGDTAIFNPNDELFHTGDAASRIYVILRGTASRKVRVHTCVLVRGFVSIRSINRNIP